MKLLKNRKGYIALISTIIISALIMIVVFSMSLSGYMERFNVLTADFKELSSNLAEGCVNAALLKIAKNEDYSGNETITIDSNQCFIFSIETIGNQKKIKTQAKISNAVTNFLVEVQSSDLSIATWKEVAEF